MFDFPANPVDGQKFTPPGGPTYVFATPTWKFDTPTTFPPTLPIPESGVTNLVADLAARLTDSPSDTNSYGRKGGAWVDIAEEAPLDSVTYGRKNGAWVASVGGAVISDTPPAPPLIPGQLWYEADSGNTFVWYVDADSSQWVQVNIQPATVTNPTAGMTAEIRNRLVNPAMQVSQENGDTAGSIANATFYPVDQWACASAIATTSAGRMATSTLSPNGSRVIYAGTATGKPSLAAGDHIQFIQHIEGIRVRDFLWGTANARQVIFRFWAYTNAPGTYVAKVMNGATGNRTFLAPFTLASSFVWQQIVIVVPGDTTGTWATDNTSGVQVGFCFASGTTYIGVPGWQAGNLLGLPGMTNGVAANSGTLYISDVGLYLDQLNTGRAPAWTMPDEADELIACLRYFETSYDKGAVIGAASGNFREIYVTAGAGNYQFPGGTFTVRKRVSPAMLIYPPGGGASGNIGGVTAGTKVVNSDGITETSFNLYYAGPADLCRYHYVANARM